MLKEKENQSVFFVGFEKQHAYSMITFINVYILSKYFMLSHYYTL